MSNDAKISGVIKDYYYSHESFGERFYSVFVSTKRTSGTADIIPVIISERIRKFNKDDLFKEISVTGEYRSHNLNDGEKRKLVLSLFAKEISTAETDSNEICIDGYICKNPIYRFTPKGRTITDLLVASNRNYGKTDYLPCVVWGRNATYASEFKVGDKVFVKGRIQSREYRKENEIYTAYEVSVSQIERVQGE